MQHEITDEQPEVVFVNLEIVVGTRREYESWIELDSSDVCKDTFGDVLNAYLPDKLEHLRA